MDEKIISEARRIAGQYGKTPNACEMREIIRDSRLYMSEGREWQDAVSFATTLVLRLYAVEDAPWLVIVSTSRRTG